jgi:tryptophan-rich sensory protein
MKTAPSQSQIKIVGAFLISLTAVGLVAALGSWVTAPQIPSWYAGLIKPPLNPPNAVFGPVWTLLYFLMAISAFLVWKKGWERQDVRCAIYLFCTQLFLNFLWSLFFFGLQNPLLAIGDIILLIIAILWTIRLFTRISIQAAALLVPYLLWVLFAAYLNIAIWWLNR